MGASHENPYASPRAASSAAATTSTARLRSGKTSLALVLISVVLFVSADSFGIDGLEVSHLFFIAAAATSFVGAVFALRSLVMLRWSVAPVSKLFVLLIGVVGGLGGLGMSAFGALYAVMTSGNFSRGRQLRRRGKVMLPKIADQNHSWVTMQIDLEIPADLRSELASAWRENGRTEHASVAAFARLTLDLLALGAPPDLIAASNQDALDEIRHAELCFSLARGIDGLEKSPAAFPEAARARTLSPFRKLALAELAVESLIDGALHEGVSARVAAVLAKKCESPDIKAVLKQIAADEGRHAAHGWDVVEWCLAAGGASVAHALLGAARALPIEMRAPISPEAEGGTWEKFGIMGRAIEADAFPRTRARAMRRVEMLVASYFNPAANSSTTHTLPSASTSAATPT